MTIFLLIFLVIFVVGLVFLTFSADLLVRGASELAKLLGVSPFVIGATVVAYGTSMPEFVVSAFASVEDAGAIALGNVIGSNLFNTGLILGMAALISPINIHKKLLRKVLRLELPMNIVLTLIVGAAGIALFIARWNGIVLLIGFSTYIVLVFKQEWASRGRRIEKDEYQKPVKPFSKYMLFGTATIIGLGGLLMAAKLMVDSAIVIASLMGVSERVIGLTIVALGTSLPEMAAAVVAAVKKQSELVLGNLIGSNIFNLGLILGTAAAIRPIPIVSSHFFDSGFLLVNALMITFFIISRKRVSRPEGALLIGCYFLFATLLWFV